MAFSSPTPTSNPPSTKKEVLNHPVIWDSGASLSISPSRDDFVGEIKSPPFGLKVRGISTGLKIEGVGQVAWSFEDTNGMLRTIKVPAYYVPEAGARLLSTTSLLQTYPNEKIVQEASYLWFGGSNNGSERPIRVNLDPRSNLPIATAHVSGVLIRIRSEINNIVSTTSASNFNLPPAAKELLRWHHRLGHLSFRQVQFVLRTGVLAHTESARRIQSLASKITTCPMCAACQYGKQRRKPSPGKKSKIVKDRDGALKKENLFPGQRVSVDHFVCTTKGRLLHTYGKEDSTKQFSGGAIFVDHATGYIVVEHQVHLNTHETLKAKENFEQTCRDYGVIVTEYLSDNGSAFTSKDYTRHLHEFHQIQRFAGVGAHHHNGVAERSIQTVMSIARTMMLHQAIHWPDVATATLWPLAVDHAVYLYNHMPNPTNGLSPHDLMSKTHWPQSQLADCHIWGCPVYVLDKTISDGKKLPRWKPRSTRQIFVGMSKKHASSVPLCLNPETGAITPQFHVVFDDSFTTVASSDDSLPDFGSDEWHKLFGDSTYQ